MQGHHISTRFSELVEVFVTTLTSLFTSQTVELMHGRRPDSGQQAHVGRLAVIVVESGIACVASAYTGVRVHTRSPTN